MNLLTQYSVTRSSDSNQKFTAINSIHINGKEITANKYHLENSQMYNKGWENKSTIGFGQASEMFLEEVTKKYYLMIKQFKNLYETDHDRNPFKDFPHLQARLFYKELGPDLIVEGDMIKATLQLWNMAQRILQHFRIQFVLFQLISM